MIRQIFRALEPIRNKWLRGANEVGSSCGGSGGGNFKEKSVSSEQKLAEQLKKALPGITYLSVQDISGGCGAMFEISVEAKEFVGLSMVKQHRMVTESLKKEIADMHGIRIHTSPSSGS